ncbi:MAG: CvpA family protein [Alphaproteobacteria bacterium]|nr:CvpA family protein [Alphaproteobacteria bacterium]MCY4497365.1 CvpA family protein [Rhodospirillaceae bacterium]
MADLPFTVADVGVLIVLIISALLAFARGFIKETLSVVGWVGAIFAVLYIFPVLQPFARDLIPLNILADAVTGSVIFLAALVTISIVSYAITKRVRESSLNAIDRSLGFLFGLLRGAVVICIAYLVLVQLVPVAERPIWIQEARSRPPVEIGANLLIKLVPETGWAFSEGTSEDGEE